MDPEEPSPADGAEELIGEDPPAGDPPASDEDSVSALARDTLAAFNGDAELAMHYLSGVSQLSEINNAQTTRADTPQVGQVARSSNVLAEEIGRAVRAQYDQLTQNQNRYPSHQEIAHDVLATRNLLQRLVDSMGGAPITTTASSDTSPYMRMSRLHQTMEDATRLPQLLNAIRSLIQNIKSAETRTLGHVSIDVKIGSIANQTLGNNWLTEPTEESSEEIEVYVAINKLSLKKARKELAAQIERFEKAADAGKELQNLIKEQLGENVSKPARDLRLPVNPTPGEGT